MSRRDLVHLIAGDLIQLAYKPTAPSDLVISLKGQWVEFPMADAVVFLGAERADEFNSNIRLLHPEHGPMLISINPHIEVLRLSPGKHSGK